MMLCLGSSKLEYQAAQAKSACTTSCSLPSAAQSHTHNLRRHQDQAAEADWPWHLYCSSNPCCHCNAMGLIAPSAQSAFPVCITLLLQGPALARTCITMSCRPRPFPTSLLQGPPQRSQRTAAPAAPQAVSSWDDQPATAVAQPPGGGGGGWSDDDTGPAQTPGQEAWDILQSPAAATPAGIGWDTGSPLGQAPAAPAGGPPAAAASGPGNCAGQAPAAPAQQQQQSRALPAPEPHAWGEQQRLAAGAVYEQDDTPVPRQPPRRGGWQTGGPLCSAQQDWDAMELPAAAAAGLATSEWPYGQPAHAAPQESTWDAEELDGAPGAAQAAPHWPAEPAAAGADISSWESPKFAQPPRQSAAQRSWQNAQLPAAGGGGWDEPASPLAAAQPAQLQPQQTATAGGSWHEPAAQNMAHQAACDGWESGNAAQSTPGHWHQEDFVGIPSSELSSGPQLPTAANLAKLEAASVAGEVASASCPERGLHHGRMQKLGVHGRHVLFPGAASRSQLQFL